MRCIGMSKLPAKAHGWLCNSCLTPQTRISVYRNTDKLWHDGTVTMQYPHDGGHDIEYDDGCREHANLNHRRWKPIYESAHAITALYANLTDADLRGADLTEADLRGAVMPAQELTKGADFGGCQI